MLKKKCCLKYFVVRNGVCMECMCTLTGQQHQMKPHTANIMQAMVLYRTGRWQCAAPFLDHLSAVETDRMQFPERRKPGVGATHIKGSHKISETRALPVLYTSHHLCFSSLDGQMVGHRNMNHSLDTRDSRVLIREWVAYEEVWRRSLYCSTWTACLCFTCPWSTGW